MRMEELALTALTYLRELLVGLVLVAPVLSVACNYVLQKKGFTVRESMYYHIRMHMCLCMYTYIYICTHLI